MVRGWLPKKCGILIILSLFVITALIFVRCRRAPKYLPATLVWPVARAEALHNQLDPRFVFAILRAESSLNAYADSGYARGIMQMSKGAWNVVSEEPWSNAWDWQKNISAGVLYLAHCRRLLMEEKKFSYPLLAACYRYGFTTIKTAGFDMERLDLPQNDTYRELFKGKIPPAPAPASADP